MNHCKSSCCKKNKCSTKYDEYTVDTTKVAELSSFKCLPTSNNPDTTGKVFPNSEAEPSIAIGFNPKNENIPMIVICYQQDRYNHGGGCSADFMKISFDGGETFEDPIALPDVTCYGGQFERTTDPHVAITTEGEILFCGDPYNIVNNNLCGVSISKYNVLTETFTYNQILDPLTGNLTGPDDAGTDYPFLIIDPQDCTGNTAYMTWNRYWVLDPNGDFTHFQTNLVFTKTTNGVNWSAPKIFTETPELDISLALDHNINPSLPDTYMGGNQLALLENPCESYSKIVACFNDFTGADYGANNQYNLLYSCFSLNQGLCWSTPILFDIRTNGGSASSPIQIVDPDNYDVLIRGGSGAPFVASDRKRNRLFVVAGLDSLLNLPTPTPSGIYLFVSLDGAQTWKIVGKINRDQSTQAFNPSIIILKNGDIAVTYYDFRYHVLDSDIRKPLETDYWLNIFRYSKKNNIVTLIKEIRLTNESFNFRNAIPLAGGSSLVPGGYFIGDYMGLESKNNKIYTSYGIANEDQVPENKTDIYSTIISFE